MLVSLRVTCAPVCVWSMLRFSAAIFLAHPSAQANGRCLKSVVVPSDGGRYSYATSAAPQDYPLNTNVPTGKEANYPFKLDALTISMIGVSRSQIRHSLPVFPAFDPPGVAVLITFSYRAPPCSCGAAHACCLRELLPLHRLDAPALS
jgi:hypothetical protein